MLKIQKSRVAKIVLPGNYTATHTGKSGYVSTTPRGGAPVPYSFIEEVSSNLYPEVRNYIPKDYRKYSDSYYSLRNEQYQTWWKKWGKPTYNKWLRSQLYYASLLQPPFKRRKKNFQSKYSTQSQQYWECPCLPGRSTTCTCKKRFTRRSFNDKRQNWGRGQNSRNRQWKARRSNDRRSSYSTKYRY